MASMAVKERKQAKYGITWQLDDDVSECNGCGRPFNKITRRKHHCRRCGVIFCRSCSAQKRLVRGSDNLKRVCNACALVIDTSKGTKYKRMSSPASAHDLFPVSRDTTKVSENKRPRHSSPMMSPADDLPGAHIKWTNELLEDGVAVSCHFDGHLVRSGTATWYRVSPSAVASSGDISISRLEGQKELDKQRIIDSRDAVYIVKVQDVGYHIACCVQPTSQKKVIACSSVVVSKAQPGLNSVEIGLRPHIHTLRCDRSERVCDAVGKFREGEKLFMKAHLKGVVASSTKLRYRWLRSIPLIGSSQAKKENGPMDTEEANPESDTAKPVGNVKSSDSMEKPSLKKTATGVQAIVLFDFDAEDENEMSVKEGNVLTDVEIVNSDWARGSLQGKRGAVPTAYIQVEKASTDGNVGASTQGIDANALASDHLNLTIRKADSSEMQPSGESKEIDDVSDMSSDDELLNDGTKLSIKDHKKRWRGSLLVLHEWEDVGAGQQVVKGDEHPEYTLTIEDIGHMISVEVTLVDSVDEGLKNQITTKSIPVGPIEAANCRIDNLHIEGDNRLGGSVRAVYKYYGGIEGASKFSWVRINKDGSREKLTEFTAKSGERKPDVHVLTEDDIGCKLKVHVRVVRDDGLQGQKFTSKAFRVIKTKGEQEQKKADDTLSASHEDKKMAVIKHVESPTSARLKRMAALKRRQSNQKKDKQ